VAILITGHPSLDSAIEALQAGARRFVLKPFGIEELIARLSQ
jgi:DNA-binding response OmpR family regulator